MPINKFIKLAIYTIIILSLCGLFVYYLLPKIGSQVEYNSEETNLKGSQEGVGGNKLLNKIEEIVPVDAAAPTVSPIVVTHINTPKEIKAVYISAWVAGSAKFRDSIIKLIDDTELNAIVIDVKDSTGRVSFEMSDPNIVKYGSIEKRIANIRSLTDTLHKKNIYIIGRVSVFQDPYMTKKMPAWAITKKSDGTVWKDRKGLSFLDPDKKEVHDYIVSVAKGAYEEGFDEINFDYIRYPSDGNMKDINYHLATGETRSDNIEKFFKYLSTEVKKEKNIPISADLFGLTTEATDDMGIGQVWEKALPYFDYLCPMVYPSHYPAGHMGYKNPNAYPYEVINQALIGAIKKTDKVAGDKNKIRPWLQDFDMGTNYDKGMVQKEFKAVYDNGLTSWMLWDPANKYTPDALKLETVQ
ncbi:putative glycoside hydrolase [Candidatus Nomurabacteria bacterium]|nr:putative glycoside hydrolase [Candidatus Nomurabacteria bacterium]